MARMRRISENYMGAFGRLVNEIVPVLVRRAIEIAYDLGIIKHDVPIDELLVKVNVISPIAAALKAAALSTVVEYFQLVASVKGNPMAVELMCKVDDALQEIGLAMGVPARIIRTDAERQEIQAKFADAAGKLAAAQAGAGQDTAATTGGVVDAATTGAPRDATRRAGFLRRPQRAAARGYARARLERLARRHDGKAAAAARIAAARGARRKTRRSTTPPRRPPALWPANRTFRSCSSGSPTSPCGARSTCSAKPTPPNTPLCVKAKTACSSPSWL
jgi:hypothetical protein